MTLAIRARCDQTATRREKGIETMLRRGKRRQEENERATRSRMRGVMGLRIYEWADPTEIDRQVRNRTDAPTRSANRQEAEAKTA